MRLSTSKELDEDTKARFITLNQDLTGDERRNLIEAMEEFRGWGSQGIHWHNRWTLWRDQEGLCQLVR
jgi:hypothetical protein